MDAFARRLDNLEPRDPGLGTAPATEPLTAVTLKRTKSSGLKEC
jgi:hypothetical protein